MDSRIRSHHTYRTEGSFQLVDLSGMRAQLKPTQTSRAITQPPMHTMDMPAHPSRPLPIPAKPRTECLGNAAASNRVAVPPSLVVRERQLVQARVGEAARLVGVGALHLCATVSVRLSLVIGSKVAVFQGRATLLPRQPKGGINARV